jgi:hypothetical protein
MQAKTINHKNATDTTDEKKTNKKIKDMRKEHLK